MNNNLLQLSLKQGSKFNKKKEGFTNNTNNISVLENKYKEVSQTYQTTLNQATKQSLETLNANKSISPLSNKFVSFNGVNGYITNNNTFKYIADDNILSAMSNKNGCPSSKSLVKINEDISGYDIPGTTLSTTYGSLIAGTPISQVQSCSNENKNVFVSSIVSKPSAEYKGCYKTNLSGAETRGTTTMTYEECQNNAINKGYSIFGLTSGTDGVKTCYMTNDITNATSLGSSIKITNVTPLWMSNTTNGISAVLSLQATLSVLNSDGASIFSTPNAQKQPTNYVGCYADDSNRAMNSYDNASHSYDYDTCKQAAVSGNYSLFALQDSTTGTNAACMLSNDLSESTKYGTATNCTTLDNGSVSGGAWSNAIYYTNQPTIEYILIVQDNGNMEIYRGSTPEQKQDLVWQSNTTSKSPNPLYAASTGKYGRNWIKVGEPLGIGDFVGSLTGSTYLIMQQDGNLVLYTSEVETNCTKMNDGKMWAGDGGVALYQLQNVGDKNLLGKIGFVDSDMALKEYPDTMLQTSNDYMILPNMTIFSQDSIITSQQVNNMDDCKLACNNQADCAGFSFNSAENYCALHNNNQSIKDNIMDAYGSSIGIRKQQPDSKYCSKDMTNIDSIAWTNYKKGSAMTSTTKCAEPIINSQTQEKLEGLNKEMEKIGSQIANELTNSKNNYQDVKNQIHVNSQNFTNNLLEYNKIQNIKEGMKNYNHQDMEGLIEDSNIRVLQENYNFIFWSILAIGVTAIAINKLTNNK